MVIIKQSLSIIKQKYFYRAKSGVREFYFFYTNFLTCRAEDGPVVFLLSESQRQKIEARAIKRGTRIETIRFTRITLFSRTSPHIACITAMQ